MTADLRARLIDARRRLGLDMRAMATRLMTPRQTYEQWERGTRRTPGIAVVAAEALAPRAAKKRRSHEEIDAAVIALADGARNRRQVAALANLTPNALRASTERLRASGQSPKFSRRDDDGRGTRYGSGRMAQVLALADGSRTVAEIADALGCTRVQVYNALAALRRRGEHPSARRAPSAASGKAEERHAERTDKHAARKSEWAARRETARQMFEAGATPKDVAGALGVSRQRAEQIRAAYRMAGG